MSSPPSDDDPKDGDLGTSDHDPDRAAILARRQRFIALALSGLATAACDKPASGPAKPADSSQPGDHADPQPCLKVAAPDPPQADGSTTAVPQPCLEVSIEPQGGSSGGGDSSGGKDDGAGDDATPQPCLNVVAPPTDPKPTPPQPCLKVRPPEPPPQPCLRVAKPPPEPPDEPAKPRPCLKIAKPSD